MVLIDGSTLDPALMTRFYVSTLRLERWILHKSRFKHQVGQTHTVFVRFETGEVGTLGLKGWARKRRGFPNAGFEFWAGLALW